MLKIEQCNMSCLQVRVQLDMDVIPLMDGALECSGSGVASSLFPSNLKAAALVDNAEQAAGLSSWPLLFDPQTSGGLLAGYAPSHWAFSSQKLHASAPGPEQCASHPH